MTDTWIENEFRVTAGVDHELSRQNSCRDPHVQTLPRVAGVGGCKKFMMILDGWNPDGLCVTRIRSDWCARIYRSKPMSDLPPQRHSVLFKLCFCRSVLPIAGLWYRRQINVFTLFQESYMHLCSPTRLFRGHWFVCLTCPILRILGRPIEKHLIPTRLFVAFFSRSELIRSWLSDYLANDSKWPFLKY